MSTWIEPPPQQKGMGCFGKGCLILSIFFVVLVIAFAGGTYMAVRYLRSEYFPRTGTQLPVAAPSEQEQQVALEKWDTFERQARAHQPARIEMTQDELNALIASEPVLRGKAHVTLDGDIARLRVTIPMGQVRWLAGHYMNGECTVQSGTTGDPGDVRITNIVVNDRPIADEAMQWQYGPWSVRRYINDWSSHERVRKFEIRDGRVILETTGKEEEAQ
jgi:hypothetical protein